MAVLGLSPRVRGKHRAGRGIPHRRRSIPACAGEAIGIGGATDGNKVYPRVCGGSPPPATPEELAEGLSPRVRGKPASVCVPCNNPRSIPACAGEAGTGMARRWWRRVYPRVCGGSTGRTKRPALATGLSPRVRGKPPPGQCAGRLRRSIPACAGEARKLREEAQACEVYPRVCGGSPTAGIVWVAKHGLSPRVRGKRDRPARNPGRPRSIPACAGEARWNALYASGLAVYPRVCGGSLRQDHHHSGVDGLSPRVRGKPPGRWSSVMLLGSIPACAGEASAKTTITAA